MVHCEIRPLSDACAKHISASSTAKPDASAAAKDRRLHMTKLTRTTARKTFARSFTAALAVAAMAVLAGANTAKAWDQQATEAAMDNEGNHGGAGAYGYSVTPHLSGAYASAYSRSHVRGGFAAPQRDFQLQGR
jgi:hypothetical protein